MSLTDQLHDAIEASGLSLYMVAKATGVPYAVVHAFANGQRTITLETAEKLAELFRMKLTAPRRPKFEKAPGRTAGEKKGR